MASIERTAYPQFKRNPVVRGLVAAYTPNEAEINFVFSQVQQPAHRLTLAILLTRANRVGETGELQLSGVHAHLWTIPSGEVSATTQEPG
jgi:hypothetical protein